MVGQVKTEELNVKELEAGSIAVLFEKNRMEIITIKHIDPAGDWVVMGQGFDDYTVPINAQLCRLVVIGDSGSYPLKYNQWSNSIRSKEVNSDEFIEFELVPQKFKEGKHIRVCDTCTAQFLAARSQTDCKKCCTENCTAKILINKTVKPRRPRILTSQQIKEIALNAYKHGKDGLDTAEFIKWLENQF